MEPIAPTNDNGKTAGIVSYFSIIGWLIAYFAIHQNNKTELGSYQLRQTLLFHICWMALRWGLGIVLGSLWLAGGFFSLITFLWVVNLAFFVLWIIGFIGAIQGEKREIPLLGDKAQTMFPSI
ncbi:MAG: hypothetical protein V4577_15330 [Bacteroidota bacterium]